MASECCNIQVFCRVRPLNESEKKLSSTNVVKFQSKDTIVVGGKPYVYDHVFEPISNQEAVYNTAARHIVQDVLTGYNGTIFAYGQTSSGKTHTMEGVIGDHEKQGIIPRIINDIFNHIYNFDDLNMEFLIKVSYFEIYNERIRDLSDVTKTNLAIHEDKNRIPFVKNVNEMFVTCPEEVLDYIKNGKTNRQVAVTNMNEHSSRSHSVFQIQVEQKNKISQKKLLGKLYLVDLAGSEKVSKTGAEGSVLEEAKNINKSLSALGNVISALAEGTKSHVPYRDSKLTRILQESLGGNSRTTIVICCSPASYNEGETKSTLLFGQRAKTIKNVVVVNEELTADEWKRRYEREREKVMRLRQQAQQMEQELRRWRAGDKVSEADWTDLSMNMQQMDMMTPSMMTDSMATFSEPSITTQQPLLSSREGPIVDEERRKYEEERSSLYGQLDEKDEEIQVQSQLAERLTQQLKEQEELIKQRMDANESLMTDLQKALEKSSKKEDEIKDMFSAFEEVALNLEQKKSECSQLMTENERLIEDISKKNIKTTQLTTKLDEMRELCSMQKKRVYDSIQSMVKEMADLGETNFAFSEKMQHDLADKNKPIDEETLTHARICISKLASDFKANRQKLNQLETGSDDTMKKLENVAKDLADCRLQIQQMDAKNKTLQQTIEGQENQKRQLENELDGLNAKLANAKSSGSADSDNSELQQQHQRLVTQLRDQIALKNGQIKQLTESLQELQLSREQLHHDFEQLKNDESEKEKRLKSLSVLSDKREQAKQDLKGLEETVNKELQTLHNLRKIFVQDLAQRMKKTPTGPEADEEFLSSPIQKQKITFLENNLEQLTSVHKQLVRDNAELRCELPKLEKRYRASMERIKSLETALRETKENAMKDRKKYQYEVERIKEAVRQRNLARRGLQIAKPIRPGQHYGTSRPVNASVP